MSTLPQSTVEVAPFPVHRFTVEQYRLLGKLGALSPSDRVELLEGWIVPKINHDPLHDGTIELVESALRGLLPCDWRIRIQSAITTADSEPEPDLAIVRGPAGRYLQAHPTGEDIALLIEVADTSLAKDRLKCRLYARENVACYWIVNLVEQQVEVYSSPMGSQTGAKYAGRHDYLIGEQLVFCIGDSSELELPVGDLFSPSQPSKSPNK